MVYIGRNTRKTQSIEKNMPTPTDVDNGPITVGTMIACIFGMNVGAIGRVVGETKCFCKFENHGTTKRVTKQHARSCSKGSDRKQKEEEELKRSLMMSLSEKLLSVLKSTVF